MAMSPTFGQLAWDGTSLSVQPTALSAAVLMSLGLFTFGMDQAAYDQLSRRITWRHEHNDRYLARPASQFAGPGDDHVTIAGTIIPEVAGNYGALSFLIDMGDTGSAWPLMDGLGTLWGIYRIDGLDQTHRVIMAGGLPRMIDFTLELTRVE
jgi:phage protein U